MKILTLNCGFDGDKHGAWDERKVLIADVIKKNQPDVVALQAVGANHARQINEHLHGYDVHQEAINDTQSIAFLSKLPVIETSNLKLTRDANQTEDAFERVLLHAAFETQFGRLDVFNAHFSWVDAQCQQNVSEALAYTEKFDGAKLLIGDLNQEPDKRAMRTFTENGWADAWAKLSDESGFTFEAPAPTIRIDYIWAFGAARDWLQSIVLVSNNQPETRLSDHYGLFATLFEKVETDKSAK